MPASLLACIHDKVHLLYNFVQNVAVHHGGAGPTQSAVHSLHKSVGISISDSVSHT